MNEFNENNKELEVTEKAPVRKKNNTTLKVMALIAAVAIVGGGTGFGGAYFAGKSLALQEESSNPTASPDSTPSSKPNAATPATPTLDELQEGVSYPASDSGVEYNSDGTYKYTRDLVNAVSDSIVYIDVSVIYNGKETLYSRGSGIIISKNGYIVTNNHVVESGSKFMVKVNDNAHGGESKTYEAQLIGTDSETDLAVLKIEAENLPAAVLGDSDKLHIGDDCFAIGNPLGLETSVSKGIISGLNRKVSTTNHALTSIQTDAAINSGNSGGALFNGYGEVIGVVNEKYVSSNAESLGFAITINDAKSAIEDLISKGYVSGRALLGITYKLIPEAYAKRYGIPAGMLIKSIDSSLAIGKSDLRVGDTITEIDGESVITGDVSKILSAKKPGEFVTLTVVRDKGVSNEQIEIKVELSEDTGNT